MMKIAIFEKIGKFKIIDAPIPEIASNEVLIKVKYCGICGSDIATYQTGIFGIGLTLGHELAGEIAKIGANVKGYNIEDKVTAGGLLPCGECPACKKQDYWHCSVADYAFGVTKPGAYAEYLKVPARFLHKLPDNVSFEEATFINPLTDVIHGVISAGFQPGMNVLVMGAGALGLLTMQYLKSQGTGKVFVTEIDKKRAKLAKKLGADYVFDPEKENLYVTLDPLTNYQGPDLVIDCAGSKKAIYDAFSLVKHGGKILILALYHGLVELDLLTLVMRRIIIQGELSSVFEEYPIALELISKGKVRVKEMISGIIPLEKVNETFKKFMNPKFSFVKYLIKP